MPPRNKTGNGVVVVIDVGKAVCSGPDPTFFSRSKECLRFILQRKIFADKCYDSLGVVLFGTAGTSNQLATDDQYQHITVLQELRIVDWDMMNQIENQGCGGSSGDWLDAVVVAMNLLHDPDRKKFAGKKIVLLTDFSSEFKDDQTEAITLGLQNEEIELLVIGPDFSELTQDEEEDKEAGTSESDNTASPKKSSLSCNGKPKTIIQKAGETVVASIAAKVDGSLWSMEEALPQLMFYDKNKRNPANWNTTLDIGSEFKIPITGRIVMKQTILPTWKKSYRGNPAAVIKKEVSYHLYDRQQTVVPKEEVIRGYFYGTTLVPFSDVEMQMTYKSRSPRSLSVLGFTETKNVPLWLRSGNQVLAVTARNKEDDSAVALSALIRAMVEVDMVAITRRVYSQNFNPKLGVLIPEITKEHECLLWIQLPFVQDVQHLLFPSLEHKMNKLKVEEKEAMDSFIDSMMDMAEEEEEEFINPNYTLNPQIQHFYNVLTHRALNPTAKMPEVAPHVKKILSTPEELCEARDREAEALKKMFPVETKAPSKRQRILFDTPEEDSKPKEKRIHTDDNLSASDLVYHHVTRVTTIDPVYDFLTLLKGDAPDFKDICKQMGEVVGMLVDKLAEVKSSAASLVLVEKVISALTTFRQESCAIEPAMYNGFLSSHFKDRVMTLALNDLWSRITGDNLGLITVGESSRSTVESAEAAAFLELKQTALPPPTAVAEGGKDDVEDLLDDL